MRKCWKFLIILFLCLSVAGCGRKPPAQIRVVTQVDVVYDYGYGQIQRHYTQPQKIQLVLNYLRLQENLGPADMDPERVKGSAFRIDVRLSDGTGRVYYQRCGRYLSKEYHSWQKIDPKQAALFSQMLQRTPTDL